MTPRRRRSLSCALVAALILPVLAAAVPPASAAPTDAWMTAMVVEKEDGAALAPKVASNPSGNALAIYTQNNATRQNLMSSPYAAGLGWGSASIVQGELPGYSMQVDFEMDAHGNAIAVWLQYTTFTATVWSNHYEAGWGWGSPVCLQMDNTTYAWTPQVSVGADGQAMAVWADAEAGRYNAWANRYVPGSGWQGAELIEQDDVSNVTTPEVAVDSIGNAVAVWGTTGGGVLQNVSANRYTAGVGWGSATLIETNDVGNGVAPQVGFDGQGNALVVWHQSDGTRQSIYSNRFVADVGWGRAELVESDDTVDFINARLTVDVSGNALAIWHQAPFYIDKILASRYTAGVGWGRVATLVSAPGTIIQWASLDGDGKGGAVVVWPQSDGTWIRAWAARYDTASGWRAPTRIEAGVTGLNPSDTLSVAVDKGGNAIAVFTMYDGTTYSIFANRYAAVDVTPPSIGFVTPSGGSVIDYPSIFVSGITEPDATVTVSGAVAAVASDGSFGLWVGLLPGVNLLVATATDAAGNSAQAVLSVTFVDPVVALQAQLAAAQASLAAADANVTTAQADVAAAQARVDALEAAGNGTQAELDAAHANLTAAQASVSTLQASVASAQVALAASQARVASVEANATTARDNAASAEARLSALENSTVQTPGDSGQAGLAMLLAAVGIGVGAVGCALAVRARKPVVVRETVVTSAPKSPPAP